mmetsp:Transcript_1072/g.1724  ORF Transcript_1072/g.1724 Transcript_1072/m.1724 type:complete len:496 (-) Transcript_1072:171-1658(-)
MVEVDAAVLAAGSAVIATLVGVVVCMSSQNTSPKSNNKQTKKQSKKKSDTVKTEKNTSSQQKVSTKSAAPAPKPQEPVKVTTPEVDAVTPAAATEKKGKKSKETPEQRAARLERQKLAKQKKKESEAAAIEASVVSAPKEPKVVEPAPTPAMPAADGWNVVEDKRKQKPKKAKKEASTPVASEAAVPAAPEHASVKVPVDAKKIGALIGPKGVTLRAIQEASGVTLTMPKVDRDAGPTSVTVVGTAEAINKAKAIIDEICVKGYASVLEGDNFQESSITVGSMYLSEIIGKNGSCIRTLQDKLGVRVSIPVGAGKDDKATVKIGIAGPRENIARAKEVIREIQQFFHSPVTHPGLVHSALDIPSRMYNNIIGAKGSEIRHIQNNFKVAVHIPGAQSVTQNVLVVGEQDGVNKAVRYIQKIVAQIGAEEAAAADVAETWNEQSADTDDAPETEEWMAKYMYDRSQSQKPVSLLGAAEAKAAAETNAWKQSTDAEGW